MALLPHFSTGRLRTLLLGLTLASTFFLAGFYLGGGDEALFPRQFFGLDAFAVKVHALGRRRPSGGKGENATRSGIFSGPTTEKTEKKVTYTGMNASKASWGGPRTPVLKNGTTKVDQISSSRALEQVRIRGAIVSRFLPGAEVGKGKYLQTIVLGAKN